MSDELRNAWEPIAREIAQQVGIDPDIFVSLINLESKFDPNALAADGSSGIAQIQPKFHQVDVWDAYASLWYSARLLRQYHDDWGRWDMALASYNAGITAVSMRGSIPLNGRTELFVARILSDAVGMRTIVPCAPTPKIDYDLTDTMSVWMSMTIALVGR